jgi:hypothetical protein
MSTLYFCSIAMLPAKPSFLDGFCETSVRNLNSIIFILMLSYFRLHARACIPEHGVIPLIKFLRAFIGRDYVKKQTILPGTINFIKQGLADLLQALVHF